MMTSYTLPAEDLNEAFMQKLRKSFSGKNVEITVTEIDDIDDTEYLLRSQANREHLLRAIKDVEEGKNLIEVDMSSFK
jgi:antitoxin YefM